jgi:hypothetical protein
MVLAFYEIIMFVLKEVSDALEFFKMVKFLKRLE